LYEIIAQLPRGAAYVEVRAISGKGRFDVLQVWGQAYKAEYRIRLIYAQVQGSCTLMGQEILEASNPY
jgi:hypothetical protein